MSFLQQREDESKCFHHSWGKGEVVAIGIHFSGIGGTATRFHMNAMGESRLQGVDEVIAGAHVPARSSHGWEELYAVTWGFCRSLGAPLSKWAWCALSWSVRSSPGRR